MFTSYPQVKEIPGIGSVTFEKNKSARHLRLRLKSQQDIRVTVPRFCSFSVAERFLDQRKEWLQRSIKKFDQKVVISKIKQKPQREDHRKKAAQLIIPIVEDIAREHGFVYGDVRIKNITSRWGSCSGKKNLNFSMYLVDMPLEYAAYVVAHELCHTVHMHHQKAFWDLLESVYPQARKIDRAMRQFVVV